MTRPGYDHGPDWRARRRALAANLKRIRDDLRSGRADERQQRPQQARPPPPPIDHDGEQYLLPFGPLVD